MSLLTYPQAEEWLTKEEESISIHLHPTTREKLIIACNAALVEEHLDVLSDEMQYLLNNGHC